MGTLKGRPKRDPTLCGGVGEYSISHCDLLIQHFAKGGSFRSFAGVVKVSYNTLFFWLREHPEFAETRKRYEPTSHLWWEEVGRKSLFLKNDVRFNSTVYGFFMSRMHGMVDTSQLKPEDLQDPYKLSYEELENVIQTAEESLQYLKAVQADKHGLLDEDSNIIEVKKNET